MSDSMLQHTPYSLTDSALSTHLFQFILDSPTNPSPNSLFHSEHHNSNPQPKFHTRTRLLSILQSKSRNLGHNLPPLAFWVLELGGAMRCLLPSTTPSLRRKVL